MAPMILKIKSKLLLWCSSPMRSGSFLHLHPYLLATLLLSHIYQIPRIFKNYFSQIRPDCSYLKAFVLSLKSSSHTGFLLAGSQFKYHLFKKSSITTYSHFHTQLAYYMRNSHHYLKLSCTYLLTYLSISALTVYLNSLSKDSVYVAIKG